MATYDNLLANPKVRDNIERMLPDRLVHTLHTTHRATRNQPALVQAFMERLEKLMAATSAPSFVAVATDEHLYKIYPEGPDRCTIAVDHSWWVYDALEENMEGLALEKPKEQVLRFFASLSARVRWVSVDNDSMHEGEKDDFYPSCAFEPTFYPPTFQLHIPQHYQ